MALWSRAISHLPRLKNPNVDITEAIELWLTITLPPLMSIGGERLDFRCWK